jgi:hypothetical protein
MRRRAALELVPVAVLWAVAATAVALPARRVVDWFVMTDELLYERLAFSVARTGSPLPALHGARVPVANQLYPVLLGAFTGGGLVPDWLARAHTFNAIAMTSAVVPAYLLARDLLGSRALAYTSAALSTLVPWLVLASFVLSEAVAYPAFVWAVYLVQRTVLRPSHTADALALVGLMLAFLARTQFVVLFAVAAIACALDWRRHRVVLGAIGVAVVLALALALLGHSVFGTYSSTTGGSVLSLDLLRSLLEHAAMLALGLGLLPAIVGGAWLAARWRERAVLVSALAVLALIAEVTSFDLRFGGGLPRDRYLFYAAPLLLTAFVGALFDTGLPRAALAAAAVAVTAGLALAPLPVFDKLNVDTPASILDDYVDRNGGAAMLVVAALMLVGILVLARAFVPRRVVATVLIAATAAALVSETAYAFDRLFRVNGTSGRPITVTQGGVFDWVDRTVGTGASVTMIPYAQIVSDYWATAAYWWDFEFWNRSVTHAAYPGNRYAEIQSTFPKLDLRFDPATGLASTSPTRYVAISDRESRFWIAGPTVSLTRDVRLIDAGTKWRALWITRGLDDDGFTRPGHTASIRLYPQAGQTHALRRFVSVHLVAHTAPMTAELDATHVSLPGESDTDAQIAVCVPARASATIRLTPHGAATVYGDMGTRAGIGESRVRSVQVGRISVADETAPC